MMEKRRWNSVRSYLCGDELLNSVLAEEDSTFRSSDATTVTLTQFNSVLAEKDSASFKSSEPAGSQLNSVLEGDDDSLSVKSSEATVTQPITEDFDDIKAGIPGEETEQDIRVQSLNSASKVMKEEQAATIIQSAFRGFLVITLSKNTEIYYVIFLAVKCFNKEHRLQGLVIFSNGY